MFTCEVDHREGKREAHEQFYLSPHENQEDEELKIYVYLMMKY